MSLFNSTFVGNLTADAEFKTLQNSEKSPINFSIAINMKENEVVYINFVYWTKTAEPTKILEFLKKGQKVAVVSDYIKEEKYSTKDGTQKEKLVFGVSKIDLCGSAKQQ